MHFALNVHIVVLLGSRLEFVGDAFAGGGGGGRFLSDFDLLDLLHEGLVVFVGVNGGVLVAGLSK